MRRILIALILLILFAGVCAAQTNQPATRLATRFSQYTFANRPTTNIAAGTRITITDCLTIDCTAGGGTIRADLRWTGSAYEVMASVGGVAGVNVPNGAPTDDNTWIGNGTAWEKKALLSGLVSYNTTGNAVAGRTITSTTLTVANGDGISANPTIELTAGTKKLSRPGGVTTTITNWPGESYHATEDWIPAGAVCLTAGARICGSGGFLWWMTGTNCVLAAPAANETAHPGVRVVRTGATGNNTCEFQTTAAAGSLTWDNMFDMIWVVKGVQTDTNTRQAFGLTSDAGVDPLVTGTFFRKKHSGDAGGADTNWQFVCGDGTASNNDTGVAHGTGWFTMRLARVDATNIGYAICSGEGCALPALTNVTTNCPTGTGEARPSVQTETATTAAKDLNLDYIDLIVTALTVRY